MRKFKAAIFSAIWQSLLGHHILVDKAAQVGITNVNLSYLKTGKVKAVRFSTLDAICKILKCQPGDILEYVEDED